jgi:hypothetical protein
MKCTYLKMLKLLAQMSEIKQAIRTIFFTLASSQEVPGRCPQYLKEETPHLTNLAQLQPQL